MFRSMISRIRSSDRPWPWGLSCVLAVFGATALVSALLPPLCGPPRRAGFSADRNLDGLVYEIYWGDNSQVRRALRRVRDINQHDVTGLSPLGHAAVTGRHDAAEVCRLLIDHGAALNGRDCVGSTPLILAACMNHEQVAATLLRAGSDPNARNDSGITALHWTADDPESAAVVEMLLEAGADPQARDREGRTPGDYAREAGNLQATALLESFEPSKTRAVASRARHSAP